MICEICSSGLVTEGVGTRMVGDVHLEVCDTCEQALGGFALPAKAELMPLWLEILPGCLIPAMGIGVAYCLYCVWRQLP